MCWQVKYLSGKNLIHFLLNGRVLDMTANLLSARCFVGAASRLVTDESKIYNTLFCLHADYYLKYKIY